MSAGMPQMTPEQMAIAPLMPNPYGLPPNFNDPVTTAPTAIVVTTIFLAIATLAVTMRIFCRIKVVKRTGLDDWASVAALLFSATMAGFFFYLLDVKVLGRHAWDTRLIVFIKPITMSGLTAIQITGNLANFFAKAAVLLFVQRLFPRKVSPKTAYAVWFGLIANAITYIILTIYLCVTCIPRVGTHGLTPAACSGPFQTRLGIGAAAVNASLDIYAFAVSVPSLWMLQMPLRRKISVVGVLALGLCACALSFATLGKRVVSDPYDDPTWNQVTPLTLGVLEPLLAITTSCLPALPALWKELSTNGTASLKRLLSRISSTTSLRSKGSNIRSTNNGSDDHSMKSLNSHGLTQNSDVELGRPHIHVKNTYTVASTQRETSPV